MESTDKIILGSRMTNTPSQSFTQASQHDSTTNGTLSLPSSSSPDHPPEWAAKLIEGVSNVSSRLTTIENSLAIIMQHILAQNIASLPENVVAQPPAPEAGRKLSQSSSDESSDSSDESPRRRRSTSPKRRRSPSPQRRSPSPPRSTRQHSNSSSTTPKVTAKGYPIDYYIIHKGHMKITPVESDSNRALRPSGSWSREKAERLIHDLSRENPKLCLSSSIADEFEVVLTSNPPITIPSQCVRVNLRKELKFSPTSYDRRDVLVKIRPTKWIHADTWDGGYNNPTTSDKKSLLREVFQDRRLKPDYFIEIGVSEFVVGFNTVSDAVKAVELHGSFLGKTAMAIFVEPLTRDDSSNGSRIYF
eukprot:TRINITY_DN5135_c0_g1_i2.p1 TRINITY_DN5135_c0_g1~~TRINITY_DN5135_c0_g1_i2.p1  ORF type:complete len:361 (-),score=41.18 TRINITY_DN5135_c0_g1_i2:74-1156(-)